MTSTNSASADSLEMGSSSDLGSSAERGDRLALALTRLKQSRPLVHNITNYVAMDLSANVLLALGASPAMIHAPEEAAAFAKISSALVLNIGTLSSSWVEAMERAQAASTCPVVVDPVGAGATEYRTRVARALIDNRPTLVRGNASEILAVVGEDGATRGVDSTAGVEAAHLAARRLAKKTGGLVAVTGPVDFVTDGEIALEIFGGDPLMNQVTAVGCALTATCAAFLGAHGAASPNDALIAVASATATFKLAGSAAKKRAHGPGSFRVEFLDALAAVDAEALRAADVRLVVAR